MCWNSVQWFIIGAVVGVGWIGVVVDDVDDGGGGDDVSTGDCDSGCGALLFDGDWDAFDAGGFITTDEFAPLNISAGNSVTFDSFKFDFCNPLTRSCGTLNGLTELLAWNRTENK